MPTINLVRFRKLICTNGIYSNHRIPPADALNATLTEAQGLDWNDERFQDLIIINGDNISQRLKKKFVYLLDKSTSPKPSPKLTHSHPLQPEKGESSTPKGSPDPNQYGSYEAPTKLDCVTIPPLKNEATITLFFP